MPYYAGKHFDGTNSALYTTVNHCDSHFKTDAIVSRNGCELKLFNSYGVWPSARYRNVCTIETYLTETVDHSEGEYLEQL